MGPLSVRTETPAVRRRLHRSSALFLVGATLLLGIAIPVSVHAATAHALADSSASDQVNTLFSNLRSWLMGILFGLATAVLTYGGVRYLLASLHGEPGDIESAKRAFRAAGVGYALAALAPLVVTIFQQILGKN